MTPDLCFEDFPVGRVFRAGPRVVTKDEIVAFAQEFDPQPFHLDEEAAKDSLLGGLAASGWHTCCLVMRMMCDAYVLRSSSMGAPGVDEVRWLKPLRPGDALSMEARVTAARLSSSRPGLGVVSFEWDITTQDGKIAWMKGSAFYGTRAAS